LPHPVGVGIRLIGDGDLPPLEAEEEALLGPKVVPQRRLYFSAGRAAARGALIDLGLGAAAIGRGPGGEPLWPEGVVGAITHAGPVALAIVGRTQQYAGLGLDVEELGRNLSARVARLVCRPAEMEWVDVGSGTRRLIMLFSAKEAVFKALFPIERVWLGFADAELTWVEQRCGFEARLVKAAGARYPSGSVLPVFCSLTATQVLSTTYCLA
jgi:enterobactin synthetase component D